jgi:hypothetical protein
MKPAALVNKLLEDEYDESDLDKVVKRLEDFAVYARTDDAQVEPYSERDRASTRASAEQLLDQGWPVDDVFSYLRCSEEVNPYKTEAAGLAQMKAIRTRVEAKLGIKDSEVAQARAMQAKINRLGANYHG